MMDMIEAYIDSSFHYKKRSEQTFSEKYLEYRRKWEQNPRKFIVGDFPIHVDIETTTSCNLKCFMCFQSYDPPKPAKMSTEMIKRILDEGKINNLCSVKFQYRGEPLTDVRIAEMVKYAKDSGVIEVMFNTNATLLTEKTAKKLINAGLDKLICSIDGCDKETYESIRIGGNFDTVLCNIQTIQKIKKELETNRPIVRVQMVDTPRNHEIIDDYVQFWSKIVEDVAIENMLDWNMEVQDWRIFPSFACAHLWQRLMVLTDGTVLPCCRATRGGNEILHSVGNVNEQSLKDIWQGEQMEEIRNAHINGESHRIKMCRLCGYRSMLLDKEGC